VPAYN